MVHNTVVSLVVLGAWIVKGIASIIVVYIGARLAIRHERRAAS